MNRQGFKKNGTVPGIRGKGRGNGSFFRFPASALAVAQALSVSRGLVKAALSEDKAARYLNTFREAASLQLCIPHTPPPFLPSKQRLDLPSAYSNYETTIGNLYW